ncbi:hypothetical protein FGADI_8451 [Fusarium gaditjirri]|uniref:Uncharacterized protein n=1 Tax=Fusarium gaditjirri TaxID=282569 RepID=A0A8H4T2M3_9HYPO|nr:hypothetical protein FGADI_8451 [Fusarium gaditjirri]
MRELQKRLDNRLKEVAKEVPESLEQINSFLGEEGNSSFLKQLAQRAFDNSEEFRNFYLRCRALVYSYWAVVGRGIELLEMATKAPKVHFSEGEKTTARHLGYLEKQHELFQSSVGKATIDLDNSLVKVEGEVKLPVWFATSAGSGIGTVKIPGLLAPRAVANAGWQKWFLTPALGRESLDSFSGSAYWLYVAKGRRIDPPVQWNWFVKPSAPGSDRFTVRQEESPGRVISVDQENKVLSLREPLPSPSAELFQILVVDN